MFFPWSRYSGRYAPSTRRWMTAGTQSWRSWSWPLRRQRTYSGSSPRQWCPPATIPEVFSFAISLAIWIFSAVLLYVAESCRFFCPCVISSENSLQAVIPSLESPLQSRCVFLLGAEDLLEEGEDLLLRLPELRLPLLPLPLLLLGAELLEVTPYHRVRGRVVLAYFRGRGRHWIWYCRRWIVLYLKYLSRYKNKIIVSLARTFIYRVLFYVYSPSHRFLPCSGWPVAERPKEVLCLGSIFLPKEVYFWPWKLIFSQNRLWITPFLTINFREFSK